MQQKDFLDVINGILNPQLAILSQKIKVVGDVKKAVFFQSVLAPRFD
jgi:putative sterol carrier protein